MTKNPTYFHYVVVNEAVTFEGIQRPSALYLAHDRSNDRYQSKETLAEHVVILERYYSDISTLFLRKLTELSDNSLGADADAEAIKLHALLEEMIKVKSLLGKCSQ